MLGRCLWPHRRRRRRAPIGRRGDVPPLSLITVPAWFNRVITLGLLPPAVREQCRYRWDETRGLQFDARSGRCAGP
jgi:uncharacterized protein (DUF2236 family)